MLCKLFGTPTSAGNYSGDFNPMEDRLVYKANTVEDYETWLKNKFEYAV